MILKRTPLFDIHQQLGARFIAFGAWEMPLWYGGIVTEHNATRNAIGLFDVSHMGEVFVRGQRAGEFLQYLTCNDVSKLVDGKAQYSMLLNEAGGIIDDIIVYRLSSEDYLICVNAANVTKDYQWIRTIAAEWDKRITVDNESKLWSQIAVQGPKAMQVVIEVLGLESDAASRKIFPNFSFRHLKGSRWGEMIVARTGYTGEDGVEIFLRNESAAQLWTDIHKLAHDLGGLPCGLGARDTLRMESALPLYGHELTDQITPLQTNVAWVVKLAKDSFIGKEGILRRQTMGFPHFLCGLELTDPGIIREGVELFSPSSNTVLGWVTSGVKTPTVGKSIGMAYLTDGNHQVGTELEAEVRGKRLKAKVVKLPFYAAPK